VLRERISQVFCPETSRVTNPQRLDLDSKEVEALDGAGIQPVDGCPVFFTDRFCDPYDRRSSILPCEVGHDLAEVGVIGGTELVFDYDHSVIDISCEDVDEEVAHWNLGSLKLKRPSSMYLQAATDFRLQPAKA